MRGWEKCDLFICHVNVLLVPTLFNCGQDDLHEGELQQQDCALQVRPRVGPQHPGGRQGLSIHQVGWKMSIEVRKPRRRRGTMMYVGVTRPCKYERYKRSEGKIERDYVASRITQRA